MKINETEEKLRRKSGQKECMKGEEERMTEGCTNRVKREIRISANPYLHGVPQSLPCRLIRKNFDICSGKEYGTPCM